MSPEQPIESFKKLDHEPKIHRFFRAAMKTHANDLHLKVGQPAKLRLYGQLKSTTGEALTQEQIEEMIYEILTPIQKEFFLQHGTLDFAHEIGGEDRFRINIFHQRGVISLAARRVSTYVPSFKELHLPPVLETIANTNQGLVLV